MSELYYVYPVWQQGSFSNIARQHIKHLRQKVRVQEIDDNILDNLMWTPGKSVLLHPIGYLLLGDRVTQFQERIRRLHKLKNVAKRLGGFDTADSSRISSIFVDILNHQDLVFVPSEWAKEVYVNSGVNAPVHVLPHGLPDEFLTQPNPNNLKVENNALKMLLDLKRKHKARLVLFFLLHSGYRKGADLVAEAMRMVQQEFTKTYLVVKTGDIEDPYLKRFRGLKWMNVKGWLNAEELRQLYDICDVVICPSRGGGFELNALEGIARNKPVIVPNAMCFKDYANYAITVDVAREVRVLPGNPIHIGVGYEVDLNELTHTLMRVLSHYEVYRRRAVKWGKQVREKYAWSNICDELYDILNSYGFVE